MALLGEMHYTPQGPSSYMRLPRDSGVAYAAQESWVQNDTIRVRAFIWASLSRYEVYTWLTCSQNNIVFGASFDEARYKKGELRGSMI